MELADEKLRSVVHYICHTCEVKELGATKLNKILWYTDSFNYLSNGESITGEIYVKDNYGPVPKHIDIVIDDLEKCNCIKRGNSECHNYTKTDFHSLKDPDISLVSEEEKELIDDIARIICKKHTAASISQLTHDKIWEIAEQGEEIPLYAIFASKVKEPSEAAIEWAVSAVSKQAIRMRNAA